MPPTIPGVSDPPLPTVSFRMLGPLSVERNGVPAPVGGAKPRAVLALLLTRRNRVTSVQSIIEGVWEDDPPPTAAAVVQVYVSQIRRALAEDPGRPSILVTSPPGYLLRVPDDVCDSGRFEALRQQAREAAKDGDPSENARLLRLALAEWSGPALADLQHHRFAVELAAALGEERLSALEDRIDADLRCGREREVVGELTELTMTSPYRETLWEQLVLALYRSGRQTDALAAYQRMRTLLRDELGVDPSMRLRDLEAAVLRQDAALDRSAPDPMLAIAPDDSKPTISGPRVVGILLTDIDGSTLLWQRYPDLMPEVLLAHHALVADAVATHEGWLPPEQGEGDSRIGLFASVAQAVVAAGELHRTLAAHEWPGGVRPRVRMAVHAGTVVEAGGNAFGSALHWCAQLRSLAHGDQILVSGTAASLAAAELPEHWELRRVGRAVIRDVDDEEDVFQLDHRGEVSSFPALRTSVRLPAETTPFVGRRDELEALADEVKQHRLVTLSGIGGCGKTRLAIQVARVSLATFPAGVTFVDLASAATEAEAYEAISAALTPGLRVGEVVALTDAVAPHSLLLLDNLDQVESARRIVSELLANTTAHLLTTSRIPLGIPGEALRPLAPMGRADAVALFRERAAEAAPDADVGTNEVTELVELLSGVPLAIELAAARLRLMDVASLNDSVTRELSVLSDTAAGRPERHRTITAQLISAWGELTPGAQLLLTDLCMFSTAARVDFISQTSGLSGSQALDALDELVGRGLAYRAREDGTTPRFSVLELVRSFVVSEVDPLVAEAARQAHARLFLDRGLSDPTAVGRDGRELHAALRAISRPDARPLELPQERRLALGRLALQLGWFGDAVALLEPLARRATTANPLGIALVRRDDHGDLDRGRRLLEKAAAAGDGDAAAALGGTYKDSDPAVARQWYEAALIIDADDPYALGNVVELEVQEAGSLEPVAARRDRLESALAQRRSQAADQEDLPWAWFDTAKFALLLGDDDAEALHSLLRAVAASTHKQQLHTTLSSLRRLTVPTATRPSWVIAVEILKLAELARSDAAFSADPPSARLVGPVVVLAGASEHTKHDSIMRWLAPLTAALPRDGGTLVSGGTAQGVSALAAEVGGELPHWRSVGYLPAKLPRGVTPDERYDELRRTDATGFGLSEPLAYWSDLLASAVRPSDVYVLGIGGATLTGLELHLASALGAVVAVGEVVTGPPTEASPMPADIHARRVRSDARSLRGWLSSTKTLLP